MERLIYNDLLYWKERTDRKPLILLGLFLLDVQQNEIEYRDTLGRKLIYPLLLGISVFR